MKTANFFVLVFSIFAALVCVSGLHRSDATTQLNTVANKSGTCGGNLMWYYEESSNVLIINGSGFMTNFTSVKGRPWDSWMKSIKTVNITNGTSSIGDYALSGADKLTSVSIPSSARIIGKGAFSFCLSLESITIPEGVSLIRADAFEMCKSLKNVTIPSSVKSIEGGPFGFCTNMTSIQVNADLRFGFENNALVNKEKHLLVQYPAGRIGDYTISSNISIIGDNAFKGCSGLSSLTIPESVTSIGSGSFRSCSNLSYVAIPDTVTKIGSYAFANCTALKSVKLSRILKSIGENAFQSCSKLKAITIPLKISSIGAYAFHNCTNLASVRILPRKVLLGHHAFSSCKKLSSVSYRGSEDPGDLTTFENCASLMLICLPDYYNSTSFCGRNDFCKSDSCDSLLNMQNDCCEVSARNNQCLVRLRSNHPKECKKNQCSFGWAVDIDIHKNNESIVTTETIAEEVSNLTGIDLNDIAVEIVYDSDDTIVRVTVYTNDETSASTIADTMNECASSDSDDYSSHKHQDQYMS